MHACVLVAQFCPMPCDPMDCSMPGCSVHEMLQARTLEWVSISSSILYKVMLIIMAAWSRILSRE